RGDQRSGWNIRDRSTDIRTCLWRNWAGLDVDTLAIHLRDRRSVSDGETGSFLDHDRHRKRLCLCSQLLFPAFSVAHVSNVAREGQGSAEADAHLRSSAVAVVISDECVIRIVHRAVVGGSDSLGEIGI